VKVPRILLITVFISWALSLSGRSLKAQEPASQLQEHKHARPRYKLIDLGTLGGGWRRIPADQQ
jgi:hypothetical protein